MESLLEQLLRTFIFERKDTAIKRYVLGDCFLILRKVPKDSAGQLRKN